MKINKAVIMAEGKSIATDIVACIVWSVSLLMFAVPNKIAPGGFGGITVIINYITGLPMGSMSLLLNLPVLVVAFKVIGKSFTLKTTRSIIIYTVVLDYIVAGLVTPYEGDALLAAVFGGLLNGIGSSIMFMQGSSGGGIDMVVKILRRKWPYFSTGQLVIAFNSIIMIAASVVYQSIEAGLYGIIMSFTAGRVVDAMLNGVDAGKTVMITTSRSEQIADLIIKKLGRTATTINGIGAYNKRQTSILWCVIRKSEFFELKKLVLQEDPKAFMVVEDARQILGSGFRAIDEAEE